jgi:hypothetical protein
MLTRRRLKQLINYSPTTGVFTHVQSHDGVYAGQVAGCIGGNGYRVISIDDRRYQASHLAWLYVHGRLPKKLMDHINLVRADDRIVNLRESTVSGNGANKRKYASNTSGYKGVVHIKKTGRWRAQIGKAGKSFPLGYYVTKQAAHAAYMLAAERMHGEFARFA